MQWQCSSLLAVRGGGGRRASSSHSPHFQMRITRRPSSQSLTFVGNKKGLLPQADSVVAVGVAPILCCWCVRASLARSLRKAKRPCPLNVPLSLSSPSSLSSSPTSTGFTPSLTCFLRLLSPSASYVSTAHAKTVTVLGLGSDTHLDAVDVGLACLQIDQMGSLTVTFDLGA